MRRNIAPATAAITLALTLAACGSDKPAQPAPSPTEPQAASYCSQLVSPGKTVSFKAEDGTVLRGVEYGTSGIGVVLAHQNEGSVCEWLPFGKKLLDKGYHVLAFDFGGEGNSDKHSGGADIEGDVLTAAKWLRTQGATDLVMMGASKGGTATMAATTKLDPKPKAVVTMSSPTYFNRVDGISAASKVTFPVLYIAGDLDGPYNRNAQEYYDATPATVDRQVLVIPLASEHATALFNGSNGETVTKAINDFLAKNAPSSK